jgi:UDP:flavonoid glycosyltransferase YjiC (YdhE family)
MAGEPARTALLAWELGGNLGHVAPLLQIAQQLSHNGWRCVFALCDLSAAYSYLENSYEYVQAPAYRQLKPHASSSLSFADELLRVGYSDPKELAGLIHAWQTLFTQSKPDLLISDLSPTANLAAIAHKLPFIAVGNGYSLPPDCTPWPAYPRASAANAAVLTTIEKKVLQSIHEACGMLNVATITQLSDLFPAARSLICSLPELDHYARLAGSDHLVDELNENLNENLIKNSSSQFVGSFAVTHTGCKPQWPVTLGKADQTPEPAKLLMYLRADYPLLRALLQSLSTLNVQIVAHLSGITDEQHRQFQFHNIWISLLPICIDDALPNCKLVMCHGGNLAQAAVAKGAPLLLLPMHLEQAMLAQRIKDLGAGLYVAPTDSKGLQKAVKQMLNEPHFKEAAEQIARRYATGSVQSSFEKIALAAATALS